MEYTLHYLLHRGNLIILGRPVKTKISDSDKIYFTKLTFSGEGISFPLPSRRHGSKIYPQS